MTADDKTPISLAAARAEKLHDSTKWTPRDALIEALREIDNGSIKPIKMIISYIEEIPGGGWRPCYYSAGVSNAEYIAILELAKLKGIEDWRS